MDNASKIADVAWEGVYFFKIDHKMVIFMYQYIRSPENILEYSGKVFITSLQFYPLAGKVALPYIIL